MSQTEQSPAGRRLPASRLNGWKEIAVHLDKSVRTVQRWEKELGLPVHRIHTPRGEIIYALPQEIAAWLVRTESLRAALPEPDGQEDGQGTEHAEFAAPAPEPDEHFPAAAEAARPHRRSWQVALPIVALLTVAASLLMVSRTDWRPQQTLAAAKTKQPTSFRVERERLKVYGAENQLLWEYAFPFPLVDTFFDGSLQEPVSDFAQIGDLDGDNRNEVAIIVCPKGGSDLHLVVFNSDGTVRFTRRPGHSVHFGDGEKSPPFLPSVVLLTTGTDGKKSLWLAARHNVWFPAVLEKLTPDGQVVGEYWSNGHINALAETTWKGRKVILVGAMYNDGRRASLAVLNYENPNGSAPATDPTYRCENCPPGQPLLFYVFPRMELSRVLNVRPKITTLRRDPHGAILIGIQQAGVHVPGAGNPRFGHAFYTLDAALNLKSAETGDCYRTLHAELELDGKLKHAYGARDEAELFPVRKWDGAKFVPIPRPASTAPGPAPRLER
jgi:hypothetical protein